MNQLEKVLNESGLITLEQAKAAKKSDAKAGAVIDYAKRVKDWPKLEEAVACKIEDQKEFIHWWREIVQSQGRKPRSALSLDVERAETETGIKHQQVSRWRNSLKDEAKYRDALFGPSYKKAMAGVLAANRGVETTHDNEWFTPPEYIELARRVLDEIDLDPASHQAAQKTVQAKEFFTPDQDGLTKEWHGRVWLNPPYAQPAIGHFVDKLVSEITKKRVSAAILLTHNYTDTAWFHKAAEHSSAICFTRGRIRFVALDGGIAAPTQGQAFFYFGDNVGSFVSAFVEIGLVVSRV